MSCSGEGTSLPLIAQATVIGSPLRIPWRFISHLSVLKAFWETSFPKATACLSDKKRPRKVSPSVSFAETSLALPSILG